MTTRNRHAGLLAAAVFASGALALTTMPASAQQQGADAASAGDHGALASYQGRTIDLAQGWQGAHTCAVFSAEDVRCYGSAEAADKATGYRRATDRLAVQAADAGAAAVPACANDWLCLYRYKNGEGRRLIFQDGSWQNLDEYGFDNKTSSWRNNQGSGDRGALSQLNSGGGWVLDLDPEAYVSDMGEYDNRASSVHG